MANNMSLKKNEMPTQDPSIRARNFDEVALGYDEATAIDEAMRCLNCKNMPCVDGCPVKIHIPVPSIIIGFIETVTGTSKGFAVSTTNFIITSGPIVIIISNFSPFSSISLSGRVTFPFSPYEPSSVIILKVSEYSLNSSSRIKRSLLLNPMILVTSAPIS